ncbi:MAG: alanine--tRNA ligase [Patescibacteria group bacterium]
MNSSAVRKRFLEFFKKRGHAVIPSASLVPENDPSVLFTTAGMQPLAPYLLGEPHPAGKRLVNVQKCLRTGDIGEVGDATHLTFFEMLGNWSLGDYFKEEAISWSYELLTSRNEGFGLDPKRLYITVFEGDANASRDEESADIWQKAGIPKGRIYYLPASKNWWEAGENGPCGPDTEMYYDRTKQGLGDLTHEEFLKADARQDVVEIWNDVFMEYVKREGKVVGRLPRKNVDTGAGLERLCAVLQGKESVFDTDALAPMVSFSRGIAGDIRAQRIVADHLRAAGFLIAEGVLPSNTGQGYVLRRLIRRAVFSADKKGMSREEMSAAARTLAETYGGSYEGLRSRERDIAELLSREAEQFQKTLREGLSEFEKLRSVSGKDAFFLFSTYGFPLEMTMELGSRKGIRVDRLAFDEEMKRHQELSRAGAEKKFKGGLADTSSESVRYHTATHLLHQALRDVLGSEVQQKGSNITPERLRFDFAFPRKLTEDEKRKVEETVNEKIRSDLPVHKVTLPLKEAVASGALHFFDEKYPDRVLVHYVGNSLESAYSKEFCGGPHVGRTGELGMFRIAKEEAVSAGVRRIKAILE